MTPQGATAVEPVKTSVITKQTEPLEAFDRMQRLYSAIEKRAFEIFEGNGRWVGHELSDWLQAESEILHPVHLEIEEADHTLIVKAEVPGFTAKEIDIQVEHRRLTISGKHESKEETKKGKTIYSEQCANEIFRSVSLPTEIDSSKANATLKDGILTIELTKSPAAKSVRTEPKAAN